MGYAREVYESAYRILRERKRQAEEAAELRRSAFYGKFPEARELEQRLASTSAHAARAVLSGKSAKEELQKLRQKNRGLQERLAGMLMSAGMEADALSPRYTCPQCSDTGYVDGRMCSCLKSLLREEACRRLNALTPLSLCTFESFSLNYYSPQAENGKASDREIMRNTYQFCENYARHFTLQSPNLIMTGGTGLGKTHLSLAIANEALRKGYGAVYGSVGSLISQLENEHFGRIDEGNTSEMLQTCDLLILDDLGTEFRSSFSSSAVYSIVNARLLAQKPTIISTNLSTREMVEYYSERFASRIIGSYRRLVFVGKDVRQQKRLQK